MKVFEMEELVKLMENHLRIDGKMDEVSWEVRKSSLEGRGIFARKNIETGEVIFKDNPLVIGPRAGTNAKVHCVICMRTKDLKSCTKGCGLPVCGMECEENLNHLEECKFIKNHGGSFKDISIELFRALTAIRAFLMEEQKIQFLLNLASHEDTKHGFEIMLLKSKLTISQPEVDLLRKICYVLDANAFETITESEFQEELSLRGIYPIAALMNHSCVPNTTHLFDENQRMVVKSTVYIPKDQEILTTYTNLIWATPSRRHHLWATKHFYCSCCRCQDRHEFGSNLSSLKCTNPEECQGILLPMNSLDRLSKWKCESCQFTIGRNGIGIIQSALGSMLLASNLKQANDFIKLITERIWKCLPMKNQIVIDLKSRVVWMLGKTPGNKWNEVSTENLLYKEKCCRELLDLMGQLQTGQNKRKGLLMCELYLTLKELHNRKISTDKTQEKIDDELERANLLREASEILYEDFRAPIEVKLYIDSCHSIL